MAEALWLMHVFIQDVPGKCIVYGRSIVVDACVHPRRRGNAYDCIVLVAHWYSNAVVNTCILGRRHGEMHIFILMMRGGLIIFLQEHGCSYICSSKTSWGNAYYLADAL